MSMDTVTLERGATLGPQGVILPAATVGANATVGPASLVMRGESVPPHTRWVGNPIAPWPTPVRRGRGDRAGRPCRTGRRGGGLGSVRGSRRDSSAA